MTSAIPFPSDEQAPPALEQHYTVQQLAALWGCHETTIRRLFQDEPGVLSVSLPRLMKGRARAAKTKLTIPASVAIRLHNRQSRGFRLGEVKRGHR